MFTMPTEGRSMLCKLRGPETPKEGRRSSVAEPLNRDLRSLFPSSSRCVTGICINFTSLIQVRPAELFIVLAVWQVPFKVLERQFQIQIQKPVLSGFAVWADDPRDSTTSSACLKFVLQN